MQFELINDGRVQQDERSGGWADSGASHPSLSPPTHKRSVSWTKARRVRWNRCSAVEALVMRNISGVWFMIYFVTIGSFWKESYSCFKIHHF